MGAVIVGILHVLTDDFVGTLSKAIVKGAGLIGSLPPGVGGILAVGKDIIANLQLEPVTANL